MSKWKFKQPENPRFLKTDFVVEANHNEFMELCSKYEKRSTWVQDMKGFYEQIGDITVDKETMPVCITGFWYRINGVLVMFYESTSLVTHHGWCKEWVMEACGGGARVSHANAMNFHNCFIEVERISGIKLKPWVNCICHE